MLYIVWLANSSEMNSFIAFQKNAVQERKKTLVLAIESELFDSFQQLKLG